MSESNSWTKRQRPTNGSPAKCSKKRRDKMYFFCPACLENIVEELKPNQAKMQFIAKAIMILRYI